MMSDEESLALCAAAGNAECGENFHRERQAKKKIDKTLLKQRGLLEVEVTLGINKIAHRA